MRGVIPAFLFKNLSKIPKVHQDNSLARRNQNELRSGVRGCCPAAKRRKDRSPGLTGLLPNARIAAPLLSRGGESRRGSGGWGGAGQENHYPDQHHPVCAG